MIKITYNGTVLIEHVEPPPLPEPSQAGAWMETECDGVKIKSKGPIVVYQLPVNHKIDLQVSYVDAAGNPATVDGSVTWESSDKTIADVMRVSPTDSTKVSVRSNTKTGQAQISATADADLGEGVRELICTLDINVVPGEAVAGTITPVGEPDPIP